MDMERQKKDVLLRLRRIEGQVRGLQRMIGEGLPCPEIMTQVAAVTAAMKRTGAVIVQTYMEECLEKARAEPLSGQKDVLQDFQSAISRYMDWS